jgi:SAM-dependent methyltransferase
MTTPFNTPLGVHRKDVSTSDRYRSVIEYLGEQRSHDLSPLELQRIAATIGMIPSDVGSVLDVGCGDGRMFERLPAGVNAVGADYSYRSLERLGGKAVCASSERLPFSDSSFDLVLCCEVLEHLPDEMFRHTLDELRRVARKYILISVPYKENLRLGRTQCPDCGTVFHVWGHVRRFSNRGLDRIFEDFFSTSTRYVGKRDPYHLELVLHVNQTYGGRWADWDSTSMCPHCGNIAFRRVPRNLVTIGCGIINLLTSRIIPVSQRNWALKLYSRRG